MDNGVPTHALSALRFEYLDDEDKTIGFELNDPASGDTHSVTFTADNLEKYIGRLTAQEPQADVSQLRHGLNVYRNFCEGELVKAKKIVFQDDIEQASTENLLNLQVETIRYKSAALMLNRKDNVRVILTEKELSNAIAAAREEGYELPRFQEALHEIERHKPTPLPIKFAKLATQVAVVGVAMLNGLGIAAVAFENGIIELIYQPDKLIADPSNPQLLVDQEGHRVLSGPLPQQVGQSIEVVDLKSRTVTQITRQDDAQPMVDRTDPAWRYVLPGLVNQKRYQQEIVSQMPESSQSVAAATASFNRVSGNGGSTDVAEINAALQAEWAARKILSTMPLN